MFSSVHFALPGAHVLDLFAGSGQLGIEALSRGAARCVFLDQSREAVSIVMQNCKNCGVFDRSRVNLGEARLYLANAKEQFDIILLDPPFRQGTLPELLPLVDRVQRRGAWCSVKRNATPSCPIRRAHWRWKNGINTALSPYGVIQRREQNEHRRIAGYH